MAPGLGAEPVKTVSPADLTLVQQRPDAEIIDDALVAFEAQDEEVAFIDQDQSTGVSNKYQAAYPKPHLKKPDGHVAAPDDQMLANEYLVITNGNVACNNVASPRTGPWDEDSEAILPEFMPPPSAQGADIIGSRDVSSLQYEGVVGASPEIRPDTDSNCYIDEGTDEFPLDETDVDAMMKSGISFEAVDEDGDICRPQGLYDCDSEEDTWMTNLPSGRDMISSPQLSSSQQPCMLTDVSGNVGKTKHKNRKPPEGPENCFDDDDLDEELMYLPAEGSDTIQPSTPLTSPEKPSTPKLQWLPPKVYVPAKSSQIPVSPTEIPHLVPFNINGEPLPFARPPFPKPIRDRSPILGLTNRAVLRTCFRIGEALNAAAVASRTNTDAVIELYARIIHSERETDKGFKQFFQFADLFTE